MTEEPLAQWVEVSFVGSPPVHQIKRASGVSEVVADGATLRCLVLGSFQPFLEALRGHEVVSLKSSPTKPPPFPGAVQSIVTVGCLGELGFVVWLVIKTVQLQFRNSVR
ncbi:MAG TPA: hypothetical protein VFR68_03205 [Candidatus Dormibacteraeota bacterium]|nr:hypothetical protein [Candidatus Dormibacteraeota bacterium]